MNILNIDFKNINLGNNFDEDDPDTIILISILAWDIKGYLRNKTILCQKVVLDVQLMNFFI